MGDTNRMGGVRIDETSADPVRLVDSAGAVVAVFSGKDAMENARRVIRAMVGSAEMPDARHNGVVLVRRMYKKGRIVLQDDKEQELIPVGKFATAPAAVSVGMGMTINLKDYESSKIDVHVTLPCHLEELQDAYLAGYQFCADRVEKNVKDIEAYKAGRSK